MKIILLSGGSGKRLWPLSNSVMSKQFLEILPTSDGKKESMVQRVYRQLRRYTKEEIFIVAPEIQRELIKQQLGDTVEFVSEPCRRGTYNAIQLACSTIKKVLGNVFGYAIGYKDGAVTSKLLCEVVAQTKQPNQALQNLYNQYCDKF